MFNWFFAGGDAPFFSPEQLQQLSFFPDLWRGGEEFGISSLPLLWIDYPFRLVTFLLAKIGLSWFIIDKLWWGTAFGIAVSGSYRLARYAGISKKFAWIASIIYSTNTYILLLFDGGQLGVALAYAWVPWAVFFVLSLVQPGTHDRPIRESLRVGLMCSILIFLDTRIAYTSVVLLGILCILLWWKKKIYVTRYILLIPCIVLGINSFWILPSLFYRNSLTTTVETVHATGEDLFFFSVADFPHSLSLLHPNYPENLFGRVYFFRSEFLFLSILAFSVLFFLRKNSIFIIGFAFVALTGAFLGKGVQDPFGTIYEILFDWVPGFFLFRDPTKWYVLIAIAYSILIPLSLQHIFERRIFHNRTVSLLAVHIIFLGFWIFTLRLVFLGGVNGNVTPPRIAQEYKQLQDLLVGDANFGRTLWLPTVDRFGFMSEEHPALTAATILKESSPAGIVRQLQNRETLQDIEESGVSYIVVPLDVEKRIFLDDYMYQDDLRMKLMHQLDAIPSLQKHDEFIGLGVYKTERHRPFFMINGQEVVGEKQKYDRWKIARPQRAEKSTVDVLFSYDPNWVIKVGDGIFRAEKSKRGFMTFSLPLSNENFLLLEYQPTTGAKIGAILSGIILLGVLVLLVI